ncbi:hypothetical protein B296_00020840 [Ensete ventricosum]|uniref:Uncharacterized protein n=1 Tax=Ensete ventricosum TaxID=4639 RepID=A0A426YJQ7_ENSVE|nr:hypothetical protein B296_00020840 [Ensete ventricosum]
MGRVVDVFGQGAVPHGIRSSGDGPIAASAAKAPVPAAGRKTPVTSQTSDDPAPRRGAPAPPGSCRTTKPALPSSSTGRTSKKPMPKYGSLSAFRGLRRVLAASGWQTRKKKMREAGVCERTVKGRSERGGRSK